MLDSILEIVKNSAMEAVSSNGKIPSDKKEKTVKTTTDALTDGLKQNFNLGNASSLMELFSKGSSAASNPITTSIQNTVTTALVKKVGLSQSIATMVSSAVVPMVMNAISGKLGSSKGKGGFDLQDLIGSFMGGDDKNEKSSGGDLLGTLGKLFGK